MYISAIIVQNVLFFCEATNCSLDKRKCPAARIRLLAKEKIFSWSWVSAFLLQRERDNNLSIFCYNYFVRAIHRPIKLPHRNQHPIENLCYHILCSKRQLPRIALILTVLCSNTQILPPRSILLIPFCNW